MVKESNKIEARLQELEIAYADRENELKLAAGIFHRSFLLSR